jgi:DNA-binding NarL/FixJ family response regulator
MDTIKILIADDHPMMRQGLKQILELEDDFIVVAQASNGEEVVQLAGLLKPHVILMDINMPVMDGIRATQKIRESGNQVKILYLTIHDDREYLFKALQSGAEGYVLKDAEPSMLVNAIRDICSGKTFIQPNMTMELVKEFNRVTLHEKDAAAENNLTPREQEVLGLIAEGMINKEIAHKLFISEKTVKNHVSNLLRKLDVSDRTQAVIYAFKNNLINPQK